MAFNKWKTGGRLKLEWRYVICPLAFLIVLWVAASFTGHWATEENPYRSYALQACAWLDGRLDLGKDYPWLELAIYEGKYYVSFPPFPSLVLLPFAAVLGTNTPDHWISLGFSIIGIIYAIRLYRAITGTYEMAEQYVLFLFLGNGYLFIALQGGWVWYMAQTMCFTFSLMSLFYAANKHIGRALAFLACAFGCRPMVVAYIPLILMLGTEKASVKTWIRKGYRLIPACMIIGFYLMLNAARFDNPFEFGHNHLPEFVRSTEGQFSLNYATKNFNQLFRLPQTGGEHGMLIYDTYDCMAFWLIDPIIVSFMVTWLYALTRKRKACGLNLIIVPATTCVHLMIVCCHKTMGGYQFGNRYIVDMLPYVFYGLITYKQGVGKAEWLNNPLFALGFSINLIGTVSTYNHSRSAPRERKGMADAHRRQSLQE